MSHFEPVTQDGRTEQNGADRNKECYEEQVGGTRCGRDAEVEDVG